MKSKLYFEHLDKHNYTTLLRKMPAIGKVIDGYIIIRSDNKKLRNQREKLQSLFITLKEDQTNNTLKEEINDLKKSIYHTKQFIRLKKGKFRVKEYEYHSTTREPKKRCGVTIKPGKYKYLVLCEKL